MTIPEVLILMVVIVVIVAFGWALFATESGPLAVSFVITLIGNAVTAAISLGLVGGGLIVLVNAISDNDGGFFALGLGMTVLGGVFVAGWLGALKDKGFWWFAHWLNRFWGH